MSKGKLFFKSQDNSPENWISIADLMAGLMMVFMLIANWTCAYRRSTTSTAPAQPMSNRVY